jgi:hypothetical protein
MIKIESVCAHAKLSDNVCERDVVGLIKSYQWTDYLLSLNFTFTS